MKLLRRSATLGALVTVVLAASTAPGFASLEDYLVQAEQADYSGRKLVVTLWDGGSEVGVFDVTHAADMTTIDGGQGSSVNHGRVAGGSSGAVVLQGWSAAGVASRYIAATPVAVTRLGREAESVDILEGDKVRARVVFDIETRVSLLTEIFDGEGKLFRYSAMLEFDPNPAVRYADIEPAAADYDVMLPAQSDLPDRSSGYVRADTYAGPDDTLQAFYTDGLFKFSIFATPGEVSMERFRDATVFEAGDASYSQLITPTELWVSWQADGTTYVLVGDLPPDHLVSVLADLPAPDEDGLFSRIWRGIFG